MEYVNEKLRNDSEIVLNAVRENGSNLEYASEELKDNVDVVLEAVITNKSALYYASNNLKKNYNFILKAIKHTKSAINYASNKLKTDKEFLIKCYKVNKKIIKKFKFIEKFDEIENNIYDDNFINENYDFLHYVENIKNLCTYLLDNNKYEIIYKNEDLHDNIKSKLNILILYLNDFDSDNEYNENPEQLKDQVYDQIYRKKITIIFVKFDEIFNITFIHKELAI